jgi:hypothetical protein
LLQTTMGDFLGKEFVILGVPRLGMVNRVLSK